MGIDNSGQALNPRLKFFYGYTIVIVATLIMLICMGVYYSYGVFLKPLINEFGWSRATVSGAFSLCGLIQGISGVIGGRLNDKIGPRLVLTFSGLLAGAAFLLSFSIHSIWQLYLFEGVLLGIGLGGVFVPLTSTVARWFTLKRGTMTGIAVAGIGVGNLFIPPMANELISIFNWRIAFLILGGLVLIIVIIASQFLKRDPSKIGQAPFGDRVVKERKSNPPSADYSLARAAKTGQFWLVFALFFSFGFCLCAIMVHISPIATDAGISATIAASFVSMIGVGSIIGRLTLGRVGDRIKFRAIFVICFILMSLSLFWVLFTTSVWGLYLFTLAFGAAYGGCAISQPLLVAELFGVKSHGVILGTVSNGFTIGCALGPVLVGYIFDATQNYHLGLIITLVIGVSGLIFTLFLKPMKVMQAKS